MWPSVAPDDSRQLVEQPRVLDGDDGLVGEGRDELDLVVGKGPDFLAVQAEHTDQFVLLQHRHKQNRPGTPKFDGSNDSWMALLSVGFLCRSIGDVSHRLSFHHATERTIRIGTKR